MSFNSGSWSCLACCLTRGCKKPFSVYAIRPDSEIQKIPAFTVGTLHNAGQVALVRVRIAFSYLYAIGRAIRMIVKYQEQTDTDEEDTAKASFIIDTVLGDVIITNSLAPPRFQPNLGNTFPPY